MIGLIAVDLAVLLRVENYGPSNVVEVAKLCLEESVKFCYAFMQVLNSVTICK